jgi:hypothetical protein
MMKRPLSLLLLGALSGAAPAADESMARRADPWVPPEARIRSPEPPSEGLALQAQVLEKLRRRFEAADAGRYGSISREQARRAGFGFVAQHFERIDAQRSGSISFQELQRFLARPAAER